MEHDVKAWVEEAQILMVKRYGVPPEYWGMQGEEALELAALCLDTEESPDDYVEYYARKRGLTAWKEAML